MVKKLLFLAIITLFATACGAKVPADAYTVKGNIQGIPDNAVLQLLPLSHTEEAPIAEAVVKNGKFEFSGKVAEPTAVVLIVKDNYGSLNFMLEPAQISISGNVTSGNAHDGKKQYNMGTLKVEGSPMTEKFYALMATRYKLDGEFSALQSKYADIHQIMSNPNQTRETIDSLRNTPRFKEMQAEEHRLFEALDKNFSNVVAANKDTFWGPLMMISLVTYLTPNNRPMYEALGPDAKASTYGKKVYQELFPLGDTGSKVPDFSGVTPQGKEISLAGVCKENKYVLIDFWASWCRPCRASIPGLKKIYEKHGGKGFEILSVSIDKDEAPWLKAVEKEAMPWVNIRDVKATIADQYHVSSVPTLFVIDSKGNLVAENLHGEELAAKIDELMAK